MFSRWWRFGWASEEDHFADQYDTNGETLSQAIQAAAAEEPDAEGSALFGHLRGTVVGLRYYTGVVRVRHLPSHVAMKCRCIWAQELLCFHR